MINCVVSRYKKNTDWVYKLKNIEKYYIYDKETPESELNIPVNKGNEASVYLKYIIDYYEKLADFTFFIHDEEYAWHHSGSIIDLFNDAGMSGKLYYNINDKCILGSIISNDWYNDILIWYNNYIEKYIPINNLPNKDWTQDHRGSAQFLVHKSLIKNLPLEFYKDLYNWIITTDMPNAKSGRFLEWTWHIFWDIYPIYKMGILNEKRCNKTILMAKNTMLIVEPRKLPGLASIINKFRETLGKNWTYVFYCGKDAKDYWTTTDLHKDVEVRALDVNNFQNHCEYSDFMKSKKLWESLDGEFVLTTQADCWLINEGKYTIDYFIQKNLSYIAGNMCYGWYELERDNINLPHKNLNGGLSLRKRADMLKVIEAYPPTPSAWSNLDSKGMSEDSEDVYFAIGCIKLGLKIGDDEDSSHFALHSIYKDEFFGMHQPRKEFGERLNKKFPELKYKNPYLNLVDYTDLNNKGIKRTFVDNFICMNIPRIR